MLFGELRKRPGLPPRERSLITAQLAPDSSDEVGSVAALLMGPDGGFITGSDFLMGGGVTAAFWYGDLAEVRRVQD